MFSSNVQPKEILVIPEMSAPDQKERIRDKPSSRSSDPVAISTTSRDSIKSPPSMDSAELRRSARVRKPVNRLNYSSFKG